MSQAMITMAVIWLVLTVVFIIIEFAAKKYFLPFAMGAGVAAVSTFFGSSVIGQIVVFAIVTVLAYVLFRPNKQIHKKGHGKRRDDRYDDDDDLYYG